MNRPGWLRVGIALGVVATLGRVASFDFTLWDDPATIYQNPSFNPPTFRSVAEYWTRIGANAPLGLYVPVTYTFWGAIARLAYLEQPDAQGVHLNPWLFHAANLICHITVTLLVFELLRRLIGKPLAAALGALLFGLHPVQVEAVAWTSGLKDVLSAVFGLGALLLHVGPGASESSSKRVARAGASMLLAAAAMLAKPGAMVLPVLALILDRLVLRRDWQQSLLRLLPWFALAIACATWTRLSQPVSGVAVAPIWARPLIALDSIAFYLWKLVWPARLGLDYGRTPVLVLERGWLYVTPMVPIAVAMLFWWARRRELAAGGLIFVGALLPVLGFVPFMFQYCSGVADHYLYLAMLGPALIVAYGLSRVDSPVPAALAGLILAALSVRSGILAGNWRDDLALWSHSIDVNPRSIVAYVNRGGYLQRQGDYAGAEADFRRAIAVDPSDALAQDNLASVLILTGRPGEALEHIRATLDANDTAPPARRADTRALHRLYAGVLMSMGRYAEAAAQYEAGLARDPSDLEARRGLEQALERQRRAATAPASTLPAGPPI